MVFFVQIPTLPQLGWVGLDIDRCIMNKYLELHVHGLLHDIQINYKMDNTSF